MSDFATEVGEGFAGEGPEAAHLNTVLGAKGGPVEIAWATSLATPSSGHGRFVVVLQPNLPVKPITLFVPKAEVREERHALNQRVEAAHREPRADASAEGRVEPRIATPIGAAVDGAAADIDEELRRAEPRLPPRVAAQPAVRADRSGAAPAAIQANESASEAARRAAPRDIRRDGSADGFDAELLAVRRTHVDTATQEVPVERAPIRHDPGPARVQVRVMTGPQAGRVVPMVSDEFVMGRVGVQVAAIVARGADLVLVPREGPPPIDGDGAPVPAAGRAIAPGDAFEIAGTRLQLLPVE